MKQALFKKIGVKLGPEHGQCAAQEEARLAKSSGIQFSHLHEALTLCLRAFGANVFLALCQSKKSLLTS